MARAGGPRTRGGPPACAGSHHRSCSERSPACQGLMSPGAMGCGCPAGCVQVTPFFWVGGPDPVVPGRNGPMPAMLVTRPVGQLPELGTLLLRDQRVMLTREEQTPPPPMSPGERGTALCGLSPGQGGPRASAAPCVEPGSAPLTWPDQAVGRRVYQMEQRLAVTPLGRSSPSAGERGPRRSRAGGCGAALGSPCGQGVRR